MLADCAPIRDAVLNSIEQVRADLVNSLSDSGFKVYDFVPEKFVPPCVTVTAAEGLYLQPGDTFGEWEINLAVYLVVKSGTNQRELREMDAMLCAVLPHFEGEAGNPWTTLVDAPTYFTINDKECLGCRIAASNQFKMTGN